MQYLKLFLAVPIAIVIFSIMGVTHATHAASISFYHATSQSYMNDKHVTYDASFAHNTYTNFNFMNGNGSDCSCDNGNGNSSLSYTTANSLTYSTHFTLTQNISYQNSNVLAYQLNF